MPNPELPEFQKKFKGYNFLCSHNNLYLLLYKKQLTTLQSKQCSIWHKSWPIQNFEEKKVMTKSQESKEKVIIKS